MRIGVTVSGYFVLSVVQYELENILSAYSEVRPVDIYVDTVGGGGGGGVRKRPFLFCF